MRRTHGGEGGEKCLVRPKEQRKQQEEHMEGTGGFRGYAGIWAVPRQGSVNSCLCSLGFPPARARGGQQEGIAPQPPALHSLGWGVGHKAAPSSSMWVLRLGPAVFCPWLEGAGGRVWGLEPNLEAENNKGRHSHGVSLWGKKGKWMGKANKTRPL